MTSADREESDGPIKKLHGHAEVESAAELVRADEIEFNEETKDVVAHGNVYFHSFEKNEQLWCDHMEYNTEDQKGKLSAWWTRLRRSRRWPTGPPTWSR